MGQQSSTAIQQSLRIDALCRQFETEWTHDHRVSLEKYYDRAEPSDRADLLPELVAIEVELLFRAGETPVLQPYQDRFPDEAVRIAEVFAEVVDDLTSQWRRAGQVIIPENLGDYRIVREIGRGAMGVVYEAEQRSLKRQVALKVLPAALGLSVSRLKRFHREAQAVGRLHHSYIVDIYGTGEQDGIHYFAMQYVEGQPLSQLLDESNSEASVSAGALLERAQAVAKVGSQIGRALHYAHQRGVLHRDVKPANILLDQSGNAWLTDFGLAKLKQSEDESLSRDGDVVGTLRYIAPESVRGQVDERSDIYSFGLTLYELISHRPAFTAKDVSESLHSLAVREPEPLNRRRPGVPHDLVTIIHKALDREPSSRYQTAGAMADDLQRFLDNEPIHARPHSLTERFTRWAGRNRELATSLAAVTVLLLVGIFASTYAALHFQEQGRQQRWLIKANADALLINTKSNVRTSELAAEVARERDATQAALNLANVTMADMYAAYGLHSAEDGNDREAVLWFAHALLKSKDDPERLRANRLRYQTWSRQISRPIAVVQNPRQVNRLTFHPSNRFLLSQSFQAGQHDTVLDVSTNSVRSELRTMAWTPDGQVQAYAKELAVHVADFPSLADRLVIPMGERAHLVAFDQKAERLAVACEQSVHLFNPLSGATLSPEWKLSDPPRHLAFSPDGKWLLVVTDKNRFHVYRTDQTESEPWFSDTHHSESGGWSQLWPQFTQESLALVAVQEPSRLVAWDLSTRQIAFVVREGVGTAFCLLRKPNDNILIRGGNELPELLFLPQLRRDNLSSADAIDAGQDSGSLSLTLTPSGREPWTPGQRPPLTAAFHPEKPSLVLAGSGATVESFHYDRRERESVVAMHPPGVLSLAYSADGQRFATAGYDDDVRVWELPLDPRIWAIPNAEDSYSLRRGKFRADSQRLLVHTQSGVQVFDVADQSPVSKSWDINLLADAEFGESNTLITLSATKTGDAEANPQGGQIDIWSIETGERLQTAAIPSAPQLRGLQRSRDGATLAVRATDSRTYSLETATLKARRTVNDSGLLPGRDAPHPIGDCISPDGQTLLTHTGHELQCHLWKTETEVPFGSLTHEQPIHSAVFSGDSRRIATSSVDKTARVWDATTGLALSPPLVHPTWVYSIEFSADNRFLLTVAKDASARVWDLSTHELVGAAMQGHLDIAARFRPRTGEVITVDADGLVDVWDWRHSRRLCPSRKLRLPRLFAYNGQRHLAISPDGRFAYVGGNGTVHVINLDELDEVDTRSAEAILLEAEVLSHTQLLDSSTPSLLSNDAWLKRWKAWHAAERQRQP